MTKDEYEDFALRYKGCGACFPMYHTLSRFEKMWFSAIQKDVAELEKENAELKKENQKWKDEWQEQVQKATDEGYARTLQTIQLSKATKIIREVVEWATWQGSNCPSFKSIQDKAEQFISEVEK